MNFLTLPTPTTFGQIIPYTLIQEIEMEEQFLPLIKPSILVLDSGEELNSVKEEYVYEFTTYYKLISNTLGTVLEGWFQPYHEKEYVYEGRHLLYAFNEELILQYPSYAQYYRDSMLSPFPQERVPGMSIIQYPRDGYVRLGYNALLPEVIYNEIYGLPLDSSLGTVLIFTINHPDVMYLGKTLIVDGSNRNGMCFMQTDRNDDNEGIKYKIFVNGSLNPKTKAKYTTTSYKRTKITATWDGVQWNQVCEYENFTKNTGYTNIGQSQTKVKLYTALRNNNQYNQTKKNV
jgi:hypothetical protein